MKIAFDGRYAEGDIVGIGNYIKNLILTLNKNGIECLIIYSKKPREIIRGKNIFQLVLNSTNSYHFEQIMVPIVLKKERVDIYHAVGNLGIPILCPVPAVLTIHDLIPLEDNNYFSNAKLPIISRLSYIFRLKTSIIKASKIITVSDYIKSQLITKMHLKNKQVLRIYSGVEYKLKKVKLIKILQGKRYILFHGGLDYRKNIIRLLKAFTLVSNKDNRLFLVITGENNVVKKKLVKHIRDLSLENKVIFTGYLPENSMYRVISSAKVICYPSLSEGFGFPILEGFVARVPVITSNVASMPEIANGAALLINPRNVNDIANAIIKVIKDAQLVKNMVSKGMKEYVKYDWTKVTNEYIDLYNSIQ